MNTIFARESVDREPIGRPVIGDDLGDWSSSAEEFLKNECS
jgi:hypothetical protein